MTIYDRDYRINLGWQKRVRMGNSSSLLVPENVKYAVYTHSCKPKISSDDDNNNNNGQKGPKKGFLAYPENARNTKNERESK